MRTVPYPPERRTKVNPFRTKDGHRYAPHVHGFVSPSNWRFEHSKVESVIRTFSSNSRQLGGAPNLKEDSVAPDADDGTHTLRGLHAVKGGELEWHGTFCRDVHFNFDILDSNRSVSPPGDEPRHVGRVLVSGQSRTFQRCLSCDWYEAYSPADTSAESELIVSGIHRADGF